MTDFWIVPTFEQVKAKKYKVHKNYNFKKVPRSMCELKPLVRKEQAIRLTQLMGMTPSKKQATKQGYKHEHKNVYLPVKPSVVSSEYRRKHLGKRVKK